MSIPTPPELPPLTNQPILQAANTFKEQLIREVEQRQFSPASGKTFEDLGTGEVYLLMHGIGVERDDTTTLMNYLSLKPNLRGDYSASPEGAKSLMTTLILDDNIEIADDGTIKYTDKAITDLQEQLLEDINFVSEENIIPELPPTKRRKKKIGSAYNGIRIIKERKGITNNGVEYFIPDSVDCALKCYQLAFDVEGIDIDIMKFVKNYNKKLYNRPDGIAVRGLNDMIKVINSEFNYNIDNMKMYHLYGKDKNLNSKAIIEPVKSKYTGKIGNNYYSMGLLYVGNNCYHATLFKTKNMNKADIRLKDICIEFGRSKKIECNTTFLPNVHAPIPKRYIVVYDVETYVNENRELIPVTLGWGIIDLYTGGDKPEFIFNEDNKEQNHKGESIIYFEVLKNYESANDLYKEFFINCEDYFFKNNLIQLMPNKPLSIQVFAHNGGKFDHTFIKNFKSFTFKKAIKNGNQIKSATIAIKDRSREIQSNLGPINIKTEFILKDSLLFSLSSLKNSCNFLGCTLNKKDIDIIDKPLQWFKDNEYHLEYLKYDVISLGEMVFRLNMLMLQFGLSITNFIGLPGIAYHLMRKSCKGLDQVELSISPSLNQLIAESTYGGRVLRFETISNRELISLDFNSLYPSAMYAAAFPIGKCFNIKNTPKSHKSFIEFDKKTVHYIIEAEIDIPNIKRPYHPYKKVTKLQSTGTIKNCLIYPSNQVIIGCYNDVDIREMVKDGYKILNVRRGIYWKDSKRIFSDLIKTLYDMRAELKKLPLDNPKRSLEYVIKILINSMYGKFNETIKEMVKYSDEDNIKIVPGCKKIRCKKMDNDQYETIIKNFYPSIKKPTQIASYILSYSRGLMNELIRKVGPDNIHYSDTDSIYIPKDIYFNSPELMKFSHPNLCGYKNDYGEGVYITKSIFLDMKRYYLEKTINGKKSYTVKFNGLHYLGVEGLFSIYNDVVKVDNNNRDEIFYNIFMQLYNEHYIKRDFKGGLDKVKLLMSELKKSGNCIRSVNSEVIFGISPHSRGQNKLVDDKIEFAGLGYDWDKEEYIPELIKNPDLFQMGDLERSNRKKDIIRMTTNVNKEKKSIVVSSKLLPIIELDNNDSIIKVIYQPEGWELKSNYIYNDGEILGCISRGKGVLKEFDIFDLGLIGMGELLDTIKEEPNYILGLVYSKNVRDKVESKYGKIKLSKNDACTLLNIRNL